MSDGQRWATRLAALDAVTVDAYGTLLTIRDPIGYLDRELRARGVARSADAIELGFAAEGEHYREAKLSARDDESLAALRVDCARVLLGALEADLAPEDFASVLEYEYEVLPGAENALARLCQLGLALAVVADWDFGLHRHLVRYGLAGYFATVVTSAEVGEAKPSPAPFRAALEQLGIDPGRALHVGDQQRDAEGAAAAGLAFAPAPLERAVRELLR